MPFDLTCEWLNFHSQWMNSWATAYWYWTFGWRIKEEKLWFYFIDSNSNRRKQYCIWDWFCLLTLISAMPPHTYSRTVWAFEIRCKTDLKIVEWSNRKITCHLSRTDATVRRYWQECANHGRTQRQESSGRLRKTIYREDRAILRSALTSPDSSLSMIQRVTRTSVNLKDYWQISHRARSKSKVEFVWPGI